MAETKDFHIGDVLTITDGKLVAPRYIAAVYDICEWMSGQEGLMTHQLPRVSREIEPYLRQQHPELAAVKVPGGIDSEQKALAFLATLYPRFGETVPVARIPEVDHTEIDPIAEIKMIRPDLPIIGLEMP